jgi:hypothetical protein
LKGSFAGFFGLLILSRPQVTSSGIFAIADRILSTNTTQLFHAVVPDVVMLLGNWYVGDLNGT